VVVVAALRGPRGAENLVVVAGPMRGFDPKQNGGPPGGAGGADRATAVGSAGPALFGHPRIPGGSPFWSGLCWHYRRYRENYKNEPRLLKIPGHHPGPMFGLQLRMPTFPQSRKMENPEN